MSSQFGTPGSSDTRVNADSIPTSEIRDIKDGPLRSSRVVLPPLQTPEPLPKLVQLWEILPRVQMPADTADQSLPSSGASRVRPEEASIDQNPELEHSCIEASGVAPPELAPVELTDNGPDDRDSSMVTPSGWPVLRSVSVEPIDGKDARVQIYIYRSGGPTPFTVNFEIKTGVEGEVPSYLLWQDGPESSLGDVLTEALARLLDNEVTVRGISAVLDAHNEIHVPTPHFNVLLPCRVRCKLERQDGATPSNRDWQINFEQLLKYSCPGQPGFYRGPAALRVAALAMAIAETVDRHSRLTESSKLDHQMVL